MKLNSLDKRRAEGEDNASPDALNGDPSEFLCPECKRPRSDFDPENSDECPDCVDRYL